MHGLSKLQKNFHDIFDSRVLTYNMIKYVFNAKSSQKSLPTTGKIILKNEDQISKTEIIQENNYNKTKQNTY